MSKEATPADRIPGVSGSKQEVQEKQPEIAQKVRPEDLYPGEDEEIRFFALEESDADGQVAQLTPRFAEGFDPTPWSFQWVSSSNLGVLHDSFLVLVEERIHGDWFPPRGDVACPWDENGQYGVGRSPDGKKADLLLAVRPMYIELKARAALDKKMSGYYAGQNKRADEKDKKLEEVRGVPGVERAEHTITRYNLGGN